LDWDVVIKYKLLIRIMQRRIKRDKRVLTKRKNLNNKKQKKIKLINKRKININNIVKQNKLQ
jgi:hypothetical protein